MTDATKQRVIIDEVKNYFHVTEEDINSSGRNRDEIVYPRQIIFWMLKHFLNMRSAKSGKLVGGKDHATVLHSINHINNLIETNKDTRRHIEDIKKIISNNIAFPKEVEIKYITLYENKQPICCRE